jgi:hypothetical protein
MAGVNKSGKRKSSFLNAQFALFHVYNHMQEKQDGQLAL